MRRELTVLEGGAWMGLQDLGRPGYRAEGLTKGGAVDPTALFEGAALLGQPPELAALEMAGSGGRFQAKTDLRIALTGAEMTADIDGARLRWNAVHLLPAGAVLRIGGARGGSYGYLHVGGGFDSALHMGSRASHLSAGIGDPLTAGTALPIGGDPGGETGLTLTPLPRFGGGTLRVVASMQTERFSAETRARFADTPFVRDQRANRMGVRMDHDGPGFKADAQLTVVSEVIVPGDIQITGDGAPFVLMCECQTTGGYPRIGTVLPCDLPRVAQAPAGAAFRFEFVDMQTAIALENSHRKALAALTGKVTPLIRDPGSISDLLSYQLVSGAVDARANPFETE